MPRALTATEEMIIDSLRQGLLDAEIAVRLGITIGDLKQRVTAILRDFRLLGREALLDWTPPEPDDPEADLPLAEPQGERRRTLLAAGFAALSVMVAATLVVAEPWRSGPADPAVAPRVTPEVVAIPRPLQPALLASRDEVRQGHAVHLDDTFALLVKAWDSGGRLVGIDRVYRHPVTRTSVKESLWRAPEHGSLTGVRSGQWRTLAITYEDAEGSAWLVESADGGTTFDPPLAIDRGRLPAVTGTFGTVLAPPPVAGGEYELASGGELAPLPAPPGSVSAAPAGAGPGDTLLWHAGEGRFIDARGEQRLQLFTNGRPVSAVQSLTWLPDKRYGLVTWRSDTDYFTSTVDSDGNTRVTLAGSPGDITGGAGVIRFIGTFCFIAELRDNPWYQCSPVLYQPSRATMHAIHDPLLAIPDSEPGSIVGTVPGPFVRIRDGEVCAPLYAVLGEAATGCAAPGSLVPIRRFRSFGNAGPEEPLHAMYNGEFHILVAGQGAEMGWVATKHVEIGFPPPIIPYPEMLSNYRPITSPEAQ